MLDRILRKSAEVWRNNPSADRSYGARYDRVGRHAGLPRVCEMIREDIALARTFPMPAGPDVLDTRCAIRDAPEQVRYSVETPAHGRILITIDGVSHDWGWVQQDGTEIVSPALQMLADELAELMNDYNHDGTDTNRRFFGSVRVPGTTLVW
ncbi:hypothetical protein [Mycolicibacterium peregrinum]|nr:hypothetical protein [Mycolicibacterium peregrinum]